MTYVQRRVYTTDQQPKVLGFVLKVNPSRYLAEHMFEPLFVRLVQSQDLILWNPGGRVTSWTYIALGTGDHMGS